MKKFALVLAVLILTLGFIGCGDGAGGGSSSGHTHVWGAWTETGDTKPPITSDCFTYGTKEEERICDLDNTHIETRWVEDESQPPLEPHDWSNEDGICTVCGEDLKWPAGFYANGLSIYTQNTSGLNYHFSCDYNNVLKRTFYVWTSSIYENVYYTLINLTPTHFTVKYEFEGIDYIHEIEYNFIDSYNIEILDFDGLKEIWIDGSFSSNEMPEGTYHRS